MANRVEHDETPHSAASHLGLHCLLRPVCPNTYGVYGTRVKQLLCLYGNIATLVNQNIKNAFENQLTMDKICPK